MAKASPKREAVVAQVEELRKSGLTDADIRRLMKKYALTEAQLDDVLPNTKAVVKQVERVERDRSGDRQLIEECVDFLQGIAPRLGRLDFIPQVLAQDANTWARKLKGLL